MNIAHVFSDLTFCLCVLFIFYPPHIVCINQIETCQSINFANGDMLDNNRYGGRLIKNDNKKSADQEHQVVNEQIQLFDWEELLTDINPTIQQCHQGRYRGFCNERYYAGK